MTREKTKISGKLVATILSLVTCVAVMGVGVWASVTEFSMDIVNNVELIFSANNLDVYAYGKNVGDGYYESGYGVGSISADSDFYYDRSADGSSSPIATNGKMPTKLFSAGEYVVNEATQSNNYDMFTTWQGRTGFSENTMEKLTAEANVEYIFTVMPSLGYDAADYAFSINESSLPTPTVGNDMFASKYEYRVSIDGETFGEWHTIAYGTAETPGVQQKGLMDEKAGLFVMNFGSPSEEESAQKIVQIRATCTYSNPNKNTVVVDDEWQFQIRFYVGLTSEETLMGNLSTRTDTTLQVLNLFEDYGAGLQYNNNILWS